MFLGEKNFKKSPRNVWWDKKVALSLHPLSGMKDSGPGRTEATNKTFFEQIS